MDAERVPAWTARARDLLDRHRGPPIRMEAIAGAVGIHPVHLSRVFRRCYGTTMSQYARDLRLAHALRALVTTPRTLAAIAAECGYSDHAHLTRTVKRATGVAPALYRRLHRQGSTPGQAA